MTNAEIIFRESQKAMADGILKGSGIVGRTEINGLIVECELAEEIHTFQIWQQLGFTVKKGEHAKLKFPIWKHTERAKREDEKTGSDSDDITVANMFMKMSAWFTVDQVERLESAT